MKGYGYLRDGEIARVYFARCLASGRWKIGVTRNVRQRVRMLASHAREAVEVLAVVPGTVSDEAALLRRFAHLAVEGREWFADDGSIAAHVASLPASARGSFVQTFGTKTPSRPRDVICAERAARQAAEDADYRSRHGHAPIWRHPVRGCAECARDAETLTRRAARYAAARKRVGRPTPEFMQPTEAAS